MKEPTVVPVTLRWVGLRDLAVLGLLAVGLPLLVVDSYTVGLTVLLVGNGLVAVLAAWDYGRLRGQVERLQWSWEFPHLLVEGSDGTATLSLYNGQDHSTRLLVQALWPDEAGVSPAPLETATERRGWATVTFPTRPIQAGTHRSDGVRVRAWGPAGLVFADFDVPLPAEFTVSLALFRGGTTQRRRRLELPPSRQEGPYVVRRKASEGAFSALRFYQPGDPLRHVDWKATSRRGRLVSREFDPERQFHTWLAVECGRGMGRHFEGRTWFQHGVGAVLAVIRQLITKGRSASLYVFDGKLRIVEARISSPKQFPVLAKTLLKTEPSEVEPDYALLYKALGHVRTRGNQLVLLSALPAKAFLEERDGGFAGLSRRFRTTVVRLEDPSRRVAPCLDFVNLDQFHRSAYLRMEANQEQTVSNELRGRQGCLIPSEPAFVGQDLLRHLQLD